MCIGVSVGLTLLGVFRGGKDSGALVVIHPGRTPADLPIIIPARNEEERIGETLEALRADDDPRLRVFVVDDSSTDGTAGIVQQHADQDPRITLLSAPEKPPQAFGKPWVQHWGAEQVVKDPDTTILFLDADVVLTPGTAGGLVRAFEQEQAGALSVVTQVTYESLIEEMFVPPFWTAVGAMYSVPKVHDEHAPDAFLNGQAIVIKKRTLDDVGGWIAMDGCVLEDVGLAHKLKAKGHRLRLAQGRDMVKTRMYRSFEEIREGFGKNAVALVKSPAKAAFVGVFGLLVSLLPWLATGLAALSGRPDVLAVALGGWAVVFASQMWLRTKLAAPRWPVLVIPICYAGFCYVQCLAAWRAWRGGEVTWRGRRYAARDALQ